jgi:hypothetical protein
MQALCGIGCKGHKKSANHLQILILDVMFGNPYILKHNALIFAKYEYLHDTVISLYRNSSPAGSCFVAQ